MLRAARTPSPTLHQAAVRVRRWVRKVGVVVSECPHGHGRGPDPRPVSREAFSETNAGPCHPIPLL